MEEYLKDALVSGFIRPSTSPAGAGFFFVGKKDGGLRPCIDYRGLNKITVRNRYPLPLMSTAFDLLQGATVFTKLDLRNAYHLIRIRQGDEWKTAFNTPSGHYEYQVMPFGLTNAPAVFQALINDVLRDMINLYVFVYLDDILIFSKTVQEHRHHVRQVLQRLLQNNLFAKAQKCEFHVPEVSFLGFIVRTGQLQMDPAKTLAVQDWPTPKSVKEVQRFLGFANFYRKFIRNFSSVAAPMSDLTKGTGGSYGWSPQAEKAFKDLKDRFCTAPILVLPDTSQPFIVEVDASDSGVGAVLSQRSEGKLHPCAYFSHRLSPAESRYDVGDRELLAVKLALEEWRHWLEGAQHPFLVWTDHKNLEYLQQAKSVLTQDKSRWSVKYPDNPICAVKGFSVSIPCSYYYPTSSPNIQLRKKLWCSMNSNTGTCVNPPYVYDSSSNTSSDFEYAGDDKSNCTLLIHNLQFSYSGEYRFKFITANPDVRWIGVPGATLQVADLKVSLIRLSGNGTLKQGDSLNLTCDVNCTHSSSQFMWSKNNKLLPESGPILHFPALTVRDSGNYTCTWKTNVTSGSETISLHVEGGWLINYGTPICAVRGFSVSIPCSYYYPTSNPNIQLRKKFWCSVNSNRDRCLNPPYVYDSSSNTNSDFEYAGDDKSNCTLLIRNLQFSYSGEYRFRFITANPDGKWTGVPGVTLQVADLKVSLIRLSGNGTLKQGDSLNLTCDVNCTHSSSQLMWSKNNELLPESGPVLHFPALTVRDSGKYTCTWKTNVTSGSETTSLHVEGENPDQWLIWIIVSVSVGVIFIVSVIVGAVIYIRRFLSDCRSVHTEQQKKEDSADIYVNVQENEDGANIYANVQKEEDGDGIYANV
ncbi:uncharacterized protein LOC132867653 [Neoarius graeffei]|uniref:uncharacterized protein LOC132867653 n=1 Tax=Neoarius graeffei TaxID=443677 RepID=UPI00298D4617|nr:uncharacterized protein LOC132867653 [Neoarius graeffei]